MGGMVTFMLGRSMWRTGTPSQAPSLSRRAERCGNEAGVRSGRSDGRLSVQSVYLAIALCLLAVSSQAQTPATSLVTSNDVPVLAGPDQSWSSGQPLVKFCSEKTGQADWPRCPRIADRQYWTLVLTHAALTVADVELTMRALAQPGMREANPLLPDRINRKLLYPIGAAVNLFAAHRSYRSKQQRRALWWLPLAAGIGSHGAAVAWNLQW